jgi:type I restriction enzyme S subunit
MSSDVPEGWQTSTVGETAEILDSRRVPLNAEDRRTRSGPYPYWGANGIVDYIDDYIFDEPLVLMAEDGGYFDQAATRPICHRLDGPAWVNNHAHIIRPVGVVRDYFYYWFVHRDITPSIKGGTRAKLNQADLKRLPIWLPPLDEQRRIAEVLRSVDEAIAAAERVARQAHALWHSLTESLIWQLQTDSPASTRPLGDAVQSSDYGVNAPLGIKPAGYVVLRMGNLQDGWIDRTDLKWGEIADREAQVLALEVGDILFNRTNSRDLVGKVALVREPTDDLYASYIVRLRVNRSVADPHYLLAVMHSRRAQAQFKSIATPGVSQSNINPTNLKKQLIPLPPLSQQRDIAAQLEAVEGVRRSALEQFAIMQQIKTDLMSDLLSGNVRVPA